MRLSTIRFGDNVELSGVQRVPVRMLTKDTIRAGLSVEPVIFVSENATNLCHHLPFQNCTERSRARKAQQEKGFGQYDEHMGLG